MKGFLLGLTVLGTLMIGAAPARSRIAVVQAVSAVPAAERGYAASLARQTVNAFARNGVKVDLVTDDAPDAALGGRALAFLVTPVRPSQKFRAACARFRARGGKLVLLYSASPELMAETGLKPALKVKDDEAAKERFLLTAVGAAVPGAWNRAVWEARRKKEADTARAVAQAQRPRAGEIHAVWDHSGQGLYPGDWPRTFRLLRANGVTDLFVNVAGAGFAHYPSSLLPRSSVMSARGDQLAACLAAARGTGIRVHAWILCFNATRASKASLDSYAKLGWRLRDVKGVLTEYLDPSNPDVRWRMFRAVDELAQKYAVTGIHLDFVRWYEGAHRPRDAARKITTFVEGVRSRLRKTRPQAWLTAAVLGSATCVQSVGQDWGDWIDRGLIDYAVPMNYLEDRVKYAAAVTRQAATPARARHVIGGIGVTANESRLKPVQVIDQVNLARRAGFAGVALFDLNPTLANATLPLLRLGLFR